MAPLLNLQMLVSLGLLGSDPMKRHWHQRTL